MNLSKSKYCLGLQCPKLLWLNEFKPEEKEIIDNSSVLENGTEVGILAKSLFGSYFDIDFNTNLDAMIDDTRNAINNGEKIITEASFVYDNNFCSIDILKINNNKFEIYEVKSSTEIKDIYIEDLTYQTYVLKMLGYNVTKSNIVYINSDYIRKGELELDKLFIIKDITDVVNDKINYVKENIDNIRKYFLNKNEPDLNISINCFKPYDCPFFKYCTKKLPEKNVFSLRRMPIKSKFKFYDKGIISYENLLNEDIDKKYIDQIKYDLYNLDDYINKDAIKEFLNTLSYPLYYLDFESYQQSIPLFDDVKPYMQIPFQYSLHYVNEKYGKLYHKEFLANPGIDPRRDLAISLINDIPLDSCVLAYNMMFEKMIIKNLAKLFPDLSDKLMKIHDNIKDLMIPFVNHDYYSKNFDGSYSIKYVLPGLFPNDSSLDYHNLDLIHNGSEASNNYMNMANLSEEEQNEIRKNLLEYCKLDTYAMVKIHQKLEDAVK